MDVQYGSIELHGTITARDEEQIMTNCGRVSGGPMANCLAVEIETLRNVIMVHKLRRAMIF